MHKLTNYMTEFVLWESFKIERTYGVYDENALL